MFCRGLGNRRTEVMARVGALAALAGVCFSVCGCPMAPGGIIPPGEDLTVTFPCPDDPAEGVAQVSLTVSASLAGAEISFFTSAGTVQPDANGAPSLVVSTPGTVTVTAMATLGNETATASCDIEFREGGSDPFSVTLDCPTVPISVGAAAEVSASANRGGANLEFQAAAVDENSGLIDDVDDSGQGTASITVDRPGDVLVQATARDGAETAVASCIIEFVAEEPPDDDPPPPELAVQLSCPANGFAGVAVAVSALSTRAETTYEFVAVDGNGNVISDLDVSGVVGPAPFMVTDGDPGTITITVTALSGEDQASQSCLVTLARLLLQETQARAPFASACAQDVINCTVSFPSAALEVLTGPGQTVTPTLDPVGFIVQGGDGDGIETVLFRGSQSGLGAGGTTLMFRWTYGATDASACTLAPGPEFSTDADPSVAMQEGRHYIRLDVQNEMIRAAETSGVPGCGQIPAGFKADSEEMVIEVRD